MTQARIRAAVVAGLFVAVGGSLALVATANGPVAGTPVPAPRSHHTVFHCQYNPHVEGQPTTWICIPTEEDDGYDK